MATSERFYYRCFIRASPQLSCMDIHSVISVFGPSAGPEVRGRLGLDCFANLLEWLWEVHKAGQAGADRG